MIKAADSIIDIIDEDTKLIPGNGPLSDRAELIDYRDMLITVRDRIVKEMEEGKTLEDIIASRPTQGFEKKVAGVPAEMLVTIIYNDLSKR